jgi:aminoglycoside 2''-phosphotransferase
MTANIAPYLERIHQHDPKLAIATAHLNQDGLVNDVVIVNDQLVFRFPKTDWARQALQHETKILTLVRRYLTLPVPIFEEQSDDFVMYRLLPGRALHQADILRQDERTQDRLAEQLATFLQQLHTIPAPAIEQAGITLSNADRSRQDWINLFQEAERELFPLLMSHARAWVTELFRPILDGSLPLNDTPVLIHGDLGPYHILYDDHPPHLTGVIDFGTGGLGDPADDFANVINGLGERFLQRMARFYPAITATADRARFHAGSLEVQWLLGGLRSKDLSWFPVHLGRARDVLPYGVKWP